MNRNSHRLDTINTVNVNDRGLATLSHRLIEASETLRSVRFVKPKAMPAPARMAAAAAEPRFGRGYARTQGASPVSRQPACQRWSSLWAAVVISRLSRV